VADSKGGAICVYDKTGTIIKDTSGGCPASVDCATPVTCRVTGGGTLYPGTTDQSCLLVTTVIKPLTGPTGLVIDHISHGGQLGAPFSQETCPPVLGNICIRGQWQHNRHYAGKGNKRDQFDVDFHSNTPKGVFDSLLCACLGCCDQSTVPPTFLPGLLSVNGLCNPDDHKICGPQPRPAPANAIIFSGIGTVSPADVTGVNGKLAEYVVFRVYIEDRSEPGGFHPKGAVEPADIYCFQAWRTGILATKNPDFCKLGNGTAGALNGVNINAFRLALGQANCDFLNDLKAGVKKIGSLPLPIVSGSTALTADVNDCGPLQNGNQQIHPSTSATCTSTGSICAP